MQFRQCKTNQDNLGSNPAEETPMQSLISLEGSYQFVDAVKISIYQLWQLTAILIYCMFFWQIWSVTISVMVLPSEEPRRVHSWYCWCWSIRVKQASKQSNNQTIKQWNTLKYWNEIMKQSNKHCPYYQIISTVAVPKLHLWFWVYQPNSDTENHSPRPNAAPPLTNGAPGMRSP